MFALDSTAEQLEGKIRKHRLLDLPVSWSHELVYPTYDGLSLHNVSHSIAGMLGVELPNYAPIDDRVWNGESLHGEIDRVILFLTDGLSYKYLHQLTTTDAEIAEIVGDVTAGRGVVPLTSIAPSTTAVALPCLWTGASPATHGMIGTILFLREFSTIGNMLSYAPLVGKQAPNTFTQWGIPSHEFLPVDGLATHLNRAGIDTHLLLTNVLMGTGLSRILHRGTKPQNRHIHTGFSDVWLRLREVLEQTAGEKCYVHFYWGAVDTLGHAYGSQSHYVHHEIKHQLQQIREILQQNSVRDGRTLVLITADHGHYDALQQIDIAKDEDLQQTLRMGLTGEVRFGYLHTREGYRQQALDIIHEKYSDCVTCVESEVALASGLFGSDEVYRESGHRIGDLILIPRVGWQITDSSLGTPNLIGWHGGLSDWEMLTPLLWTRI